MPIYRHHGNRIFAFFALILTAIIVFVLIGAAEVAFQRIGLTRLQAVLVLLGTFLGGYVNFLDYISSQG